MSVMFLPIFNDEHKNNLRLQFRSSLNSSNISRGFLKVKERFTERSQLIKHLTGHI